MRNWTLIICLIFLAGCGGAYRHYERADDYLQQNRIQDAIVEYEKAIAKDPSNLVLNYNMGILYVRTGQMQDALKLFKTLHKKHPDEQRVIDTLEAVLFHQAVKSEEQKNLRKAIQYYEQVLNIRPENYLARYSLAHLFVQNKYYSDSIEQLKILIDQLPKAHSLHFEVATLYLQEGKWKKAAEQLKKVSSASPLSDTVQASLRAIYLIQAVQQESAGNLSSAAELYTYATHHGSFEAKLWTKLGQIFYELNEDAQAAELFQEILENEPKNEFAHYYLGLINHRSEALPAVETSEVRIQRLELNAGQYVRKLAEKHNVPLELVMAIIRLESNMRPEADSGLAYGLMQLTPGTARELGLRVNGRVDERKIPKRNLEAGVRYLKSLLNRFNNNIAKAVASYNCGPGRVNRLPDETKNYVYNVWQKYSEYVNSPQTLQRDLNRLTENCRDYGVSSESEFILIPEKRTRPTAQALKYFQKCTSLPEAIFNIAVLHDENNDYQRAIEAYQKYLNQAHREDVSQVRVSLANNYLQIGEYDKAREQLLTLHDESSQKMLGVVELLSGKDIEKALEYLSRQPLLSAYALLRLYKIEDAKSRLRSLTESTHAKHAEAILEYLQELPSYRVRQQAALMELFLAQPDFKSISKPVSRFIWPVRGRITSKFGMRQNPFGGHGKEMHHGIDISADTGTLVKATRTGIVIYTDEDVRSGKFVVLQHTDGYESYYCHLSRILVSQGDRVPQGQIIARSGTTGRSTAPHLHFGVKRWGKFVNPLPLLKQ